MRIYYEDGNLESIKYTGVLESDDDDESTNDKIIEDNNSCNNIQEDNNCDIQEHDKDANDIIVDFPQVGEDLIEPENVKDEILEANNQEESPLKNLIVFVWLENWKDGELFRGEWVLNLMVSLR